MAFNNKGRYPFKSEADRNADRHWNNSDLIKYGYYDYDFESLDAKATQLKAKMMQQKLERSVSMGGMIGNSTTVSGSTIIPSGSTIYPAVGVTPPNAQPVWPHVGVVTTVGPSTHVGFDPAGISYDPEFDYATMRPKSKHETPEEWLRRRVKETCDHSGLRKAA
jgi:hypothetical protein